MILNGIEEIVTRPNLADRTVFLTLEPILEEHRRPEAELRAAFEAERPGILGVLLDAVAKGLRRLPEAQLEKLPCMADFALWATACETAVWADGTFCSAYCGNRAEAVEAVIDADPIATAVRAMMTTRIEWTGIASDLKAPLAAMVGDRVALSKSWPHRPNALALRRAMLRSLAAGEPLTSRAILFLDGRFQPHLDQGQHVLVADPTSHTLQQLVVRNRVEGKRHTLPTTATSQIQ